jgi:2,4-diaminopentanoate dehydrogenase
MTLRVIQWATGPVGMAQLRQIVERPDLDLAGVRVYSPAKTGLDAVGHPAPECNPANSRSRVCTA